MQKLSNDTVLLKQHLQPLQASYYNKAGKLISFHINCNAPGFPNLNWNYKKVMEVFPPESNAPVDTLLNLQTHLMYLKSSSSKQIETEKEVDYFIIVYWANFLKRQSIGLINAVNENIKLNTQNYYNKTNTAQDVLIQECILPFVIQISYHTTDAAHRDTTFLLKHNCLFNQQIEDR